MKPTSAEGLPPRLLQYPILRVLVQGRIGVSIFALVTGYVCALKPLRQIRAGDRNAAFASVAKSAFRRVPRLILPTCIATTLAWFFCQFGVFEVGNRIDSWWINFSSPNMIPYVGEAIYSLFSHLITTWTKGWNMYDHNTWTLLPLLRASMLIYMFLVATAFCKARYRMILELGLFLYCYIGNDCKSQVTPSMFNINPYQLHLECWPFSEPLSRIYLSIHHTRLGAQPGNGLPEFSHQYSSYLAFFSPLFLNQSRNGCPGQR